MKTIYTVRPHFEPTDDRAENDEASCPGCDAMIVWDATPHSTGGLRFLYRGACECGEWTAEHDDQNAPGETHYTYTPAPWGKAHAA